MAQGLDLLDQTLGLVGHERPRIALDQEVLLLDPHSPGRFGNHKVSLVFCLCRYLNISGDGDVNRHKELITRHGVGSFRNHHLFGRIL